MSEFILALLMTLAPAPPNFESHIETIREAQRECLKREPAHSFSLVQTQGGYMVRCEPL